MGNVACVHTAHCVVSSKHLESLTSSAWPRKATVPPRELFDLFHSLSNFLLKLKFWNFEISEQLYNVTKQTSSLRFLEKREWRSVKWHFTMFPDSLPYPNHGVHCDFAVDDTGDNLPCKWHMLPRCLISLPPVSASIRVASGMCLNCSGG